MPPRTDRYQEGFKSMLQDIPHLPKLDFRGCIGLVYCMLLIQRRISHATQMANHDKKRWRTSLQHGLLYCRRCNLLHVGRHLTCELSSNYPPKRSLQNKRLQSDGKNVVTAPRALPTPTRLPELDTTASRSGETTMKRVWEGARDYYCLG